MNNGNSPAIDQSDKQSLYKGKEELREEGMKRGGRRRERKRERGREVGRRR